MPQARARRRGAPWRIGARLAKLRPMRAASGSADGRVAWSRAQRIAFALFAAALLASLSFTAHPWYDLSNSDSGLYVATARSLAAGEGYRLLGMPFTIRPPGFSLLLAPIVRARGVDFAALNLFVGAFGALGAWGLAAFARPRLGAPLAIATGAVVWLSPGYQQLCNQVLADVPGTALVFAALLVERWASRAPSWRRELWLGVAIAAATYVRVASLMLLPAIASARALAWRRARPREPLAGFALRRVCLLTVAVVALLLPWNLHVRRSAPPPPADQTGVYSYWTALFHEDPADPASPRLSLARLLERVPTRSAQIGALLGAGLEPGEPSPLRAAATLALLAGLVAVALRRREPAELFALGSLALLLFYFDLRPRLLLPIALVSLAASLEELSRLARRIAPARAAPAALCAALALALAGALALRRDWPDVREKHDAFAAICAELAGALEPDDRVATAFNWHYATCLDRPVYSLLFAVRRAGDPTAAEAVIDAYGVDTVVLTPFWVLDQTLHPYFQSRYGDSARKLGRAVLYRVRP
jgi:hypothetical protein